MRNMFTKITKKDLGMGYKAGAEWFRALSGRTFLYFSPFCRRGCAAFRPSRFGNQIQYKFGSLKTEY